MTAHPLLGAINLKQPITISGVHRLPEINPELNHWVGGLGLLTFTDDAEDITQRLFSSPHLANELHSSLHEYFEDAVSAYLPKNSITEVALQEILGPAINTYLHHPEVNTIWIDWTRR